jgi:hypothetical protein
MGEGRPQESNTEPIARLNVVCEAAFASQQSLILEAECRITNFQFHRFHLLRLRRSA